MASSVYLTNPFSGGGGGGGTPGGSDTQIQFNDAGSFGGVSELTWDGTNINLVGGLVQTKTITTAPLDYVALSLSATFSDAAGRNGVTPGGVTLFITETAGPLTNYTANFSTLVYDRSSTQNDHIMAIDVYMDKYNGGGWTKAQGVGVGIYNEDAGTLGDVAAFRSQGSSSVPGNYGAGVITSYASFYAVAPNNAGTYGRTCGLLIEDLSTLTSSTLKYAINYADKFVVDSAGKMIAPASATGGASVNLPHGTAPTSPVDGDMWTTTSGLFVRINGATVGPLS